MSSASPVSPGSPDILSYVSNDTESVDLMKELDEVERRVAEEEDILKSMKSTLEGERALVARVEKSLAEVEDNLRADMQKLERILRTCANIQTEIHEATFKPAEMQNVYDICSKVVSQIILEQELALKVGTPFSDIAAHILERQDELLHSEPASNAKGNFDTNDRVTGEGELAQAMQQWVDSRSKILNVAESLLSRNRLSGGSKEEKMKVLVVRKENMEKMEPRIYSCSHYMDSNSSVDDVLDEVCNHWNIPRSVAFLVDEEKMAIWPREATLRDIFRNHIDGLTEAPSFLLRLSSNLSLARLSESHTLKDPEQNNPSNLNLKDSVGLSERRRRSSIFNVTGLNNVLKLPGQWTSVTSRVGVAQAVIMFLVCISLGAHLFWRNDIEVRQRFKASLRQLAGLDSQSGLRLRRYFSDIDSSPQWWQWIKGPFTDAVFLHDDIRLNQTAQSLLLATSDNGALNRVGKGSSFIVMGKLRLRQLRMRHSISCTFEEFGTCHVPYDSSNHETSTLATGKDATGKALEFTRELDLDQKTVPLHGRFGIYPPSGYMVDLAPSRPDLWRKELRILEETSWISRQTRAVILSMNIMSAAEDSKLFGAIHYLFEQSFDGTWAAEEVVNVASLDVCPFGECVPSTPGQVSSIVVECLFYICHVFNGVMLARSERQRCTSDSSTSVKPILQLLRFVAFCLASTGLFLRITFLSSISATMDSVWDATSYTDMDTVISLSNTTTTLYLWALIIAFICLVVEVVNTSIFQRTMDILREAAVELTCLLIILAMVIFGFAFLGHYIYGPHLAQWSTPLSSAAALLFMLNGNTVYEEMQRVNSQWTGTFYFFFIGFYITGVMCLLLTVLDKKFATEEREK